MQGWSFDWFAGFPVYRFYFLLPGALVAGLGAVVGDALAVRVASAAPVLLLPWGLWAFGRLSGLGHAASAGITVVGSSYVLMTSHRMLGGNILSVAAGEFSYAWAVLFLVLYLGILVGPARSRGRTLWGGVALAAALLSHVIPVMVVVLGTSLLLLSPPLRLRIPATWAVAGVFTAFWFVPMALRLDYVASPGWAFTPSLGDIFPLELTLVVPGAVYGSWVLRRHPGVQALGAVAVAALAFTVIPPDVVGRARPLPLWYFPVHALAGAGIAHAVRETWSRGLRQAGASSLVGLAAAGLWLFVVVIRGSDASNWKETMEGLPARPGHQEFQELVRRLETLPAGRIHWEQGEPLQQFGGRHALALIPYWTHHTTLSGLLAESAPLSELLPVVDSELSREIPRVEYPKDLPTVPRAPARSPDRLRMLGVRYLVTHSAEASEAVADATGPPLARFGDLRLFDLGPVGLAESLRCWAPVPEGTGFREASLDWFLRWSPDAPAPIPVGSLPTEDAARGGACSERGDGVPSPVREIQLGHEEIRFTVGETGVPVLVRISHFPAWRAEGARGPFPAGPNFMAVVPEDTEVILRYGPDPAERAGWLLTLGGGVLLVLVGITPLGRRAFRRHAADPGAPASAEDPGPPSPAG